MGLTPMEMMDRERAVIPKLQIDFLDAIALPVYRWCSVSRWLLEMSFGFALYMEYRKPVKKTPFQSASWHFRRTHCLKYAQFGIVIINLTSEIIVCWLRCRRLDTTAFLLVLRSPTSSKDWGSCQFVTWFRGPQIRHSLTISRFSL